MDRLPGFLEQLSCTTAAALFAVCSAYACLKDAESSHTPDSCLPDTARATADFFVVAVNDASFAPTTTAACRELHRWFRGEPLEREAVCIDALEVLDNGAAWLWGEWRVTPSGDGLSLEAEGSRTGYDGSHSGGRVPSMLQLSFRCEAGDWKIESVSEP